MYILKRIGLSIESLGSQYRHRIVGFEGGCTKNIYIADNIIETPKGIFQFIQNENRDGIKDLNI